MAVQLFARRRGGAPAAGGGAPAVPLSGASVSQQLQDLATADAAPRARAHTFKECGLDPWLVAGCDALGIRVPTPVQSACIGPSLAGRDVIACAQTGTGKTAAFALPILQALARDPYGVFALVLCPARELALQVRCARGNVM